MRLAELATPALVIDVDIFERNLSAMAAVLPGRRLRPHVKAHKCTAIAAAQARHGHESFTCATPREMLGMAAAGLGGDLLLANEVLDGARLAAMAAAADANPDVRMTVAVDSDVTVDAAADAGLHDVLIDVNIGLPRCGCAPDAAGRLADHARRRGLTVRGVMGYEGHLMMEPDREKKREEVERADRRAAGRARRRGRRHRLVRRHRHLRPPRPGHRGPGRQLRAHGHPVRHPRVRSAGPSVRAGTGRPRHGDLGQRRQWAVLDVGLKALGMDHGNPSIDTGTVWFCSDEHLTYAPAGARARPGERVRVWPAHIDPTMAQHERAHVVQGDEVIDTWPIDLRGW